MAALKCYDGFIAACRKGDLEYVKECMRLMSPDDINSVCDESGFCAIHHALILQSIDFVQFLLTVDSIDLRKRTAEGQTPLMLALENDCPIEITRLLIEHDPTIINIPNKNGVYPMQKAITDRAIAEGVCRPLKLIKLMVETLKRNRISLIDHDDRNESRCLRLAVDSRNLGMLEYLIENAPFDKLHDPEFINHTMYALHAFRCNNNLDGNSETFCRLVQKLFLNMCGDTRMPAMVNEVISILKITIAMQENRCTDWLIRNVYLDPMNEHREIAERTLNLIPELHFANLIYLVILPLHSHIENKIWDYGGRIGYEIRQKICEYAFRSRIFRNDHDLFRQWYAAFNEQCSFPAEFLWTYFFERPDEDWNESSLVEFIAGSNSYEPFDTFHGKITFPMAIRWILEEKRGNVWFLGERRRNEEEEEEEEEEDLLRALNVLMPFTTATCADDLNNRLTFEPNTAKIIGRFYSQRFHKNPLPLTMICRLVIRKTIFSRVIEKKKNTTELERLMSLPVPNALKNFLRFNYTNYDLTKNCNRALA